MEPKRYNPAFYDHFPADKATFYLQQLAAMQQNAEDYQRWLNSLQMFDIVHIRTEACDDTYLIEAEVFWVKRTELLVMVREEALLPDGRHFKVDDVVVISKDFDALLLGIRRIVPVANNYSWAWMHPVVTGAAV